MIFIMRLIMNSAHLINFLLPTLVIYMIVAVINMIMILLIMGKVGGSIQEKEKAYKLIKKAKIIFGNG